MLEKRVIPILSYADEELLKTVKFETRFYVGDPLNAVRIFNEKFVDELILLDIGPENRTHYKINLSFLQQLLKECYMPVVYGGGIRKIDDAKKIFDLGVDKISLNSIILDNFKMIEKFSNKFGSQSIVANVNLKREFNNEYKIYDYRNENNKIDFDFIKYLKELENNGAGEILLNIVNDDGKMKGMDLEIIRQTQNICNIPIIYYGGIGNLKDISDAFSNNAEAVACSSFFCFYGKNKSVLITYPYEDLNKIKK